jgi:hypothetical protein
MSRVEPIFKKVLESVDEGEEVTDVIAALGMAITFFLEQLPKPARQNIAQDTCNTMIGILGCLDDGPRLH